MNQVLLIGGLLFFLLGFFLPPVHFGTPSPLGIFVTFAGICFMATSFSDKRQKMNQYFCRACDVEFDEEKVSEHANRFPNHIVKLIRC